MLADISQFCSTHRYAALYHGTDVGHIGYDSGEPAARGSTINPGSETAERAQTGVVGTNQHLSPGRAVCGNNFILHVLWINAVKTND